MQYQEKQVFQGLREDELRQKQKSIISTHFNATPAKGSLESGYLQRLEEGTTFPGKWDKTGFLQERDVYLSNASIIKRGELLELIIQPFLEISPIIWGFLFMKNPPGFNLKLES